MLSRSLTSQCHLKLLCIHCLFPAKSPYQVLVKECAAMARSCPVLQSHHLLGEVQDPQKPVMWVKQCHKPPIWEWFTPPFYGDLGGWFIGVLTTYVTCVPTYCRVSPTSAAFSNHCHIPARSGGPTSAWRPTAFLNSLHSADPAVEVFKPKVEMSPCG